MDDERCSVPIVLQFGDSASAQKLPMRAGLTLVRTHLITARYRG